MLFGVQVIDGEEEAKVEAQHESEVEVESSDDGSRSPPPKARKVGSGGLRRSTRRRTKTVSFSEECLQQQRAKETRRLTPGGSVRVSFTLTLFVHLFE